MTPPFTMDVYDTLASRVEEALTNAGVAFVRKSQHNISTFSVAETDRAALIKAVADAGDDD